MGAPSKLNLNVDIRQGRLFAVKPSKDFLDSSNTFTHDKSRFHGLVVLQLVKSTKDNSRLDVIMEGKKKFMYQFESAHERENFCLQVRQMKMLHSQETDVDTLSIFIGTWNMGKSAPTNTLKFWLRCWGEGKSKDRTLSRLPHDVYVIGTQESGMTDKDWINTLKATLKATLMVDVDLVVAVPPEFVVKAGVDGPDFTAKLLEVWAGNKGAVAISFLFHGTSLCFINAHLTSGEERSERRHANFRDILKGLSLGGKNLECYDVTHRFHHVFFFGDLNYRVADSIETVLSKTEARDLKYLLERDQLHKAQSDKRAFVCFNESEISFMPTYRLERNTPGYKYDWRKVKKTGERINVPSWCDRILWHSYPGTFIENSAYDIIYCEPNKAYGDWQKPGMCSNPLWDFDELPKDYLEDQHLLIAVKGAGDDNESFGECVLSLKGMFEPSDPQDFECILMHHGEETGKLRCSDKAHLSRSRKTYEIIALDTEYHDPEEIHALTPRLDSRQDLHHTSSSPHLPILPPDPLPLPARANTMVVHADEEVASVMAGSARSPEWLMGLGLSEYLHLFLRMGCDTMASVANLTAAQVMKIGIRQPEHRTRILQSVHELTRFMEYQGH
nr:hypothetical protein BaRGS_028838 [Batillaria attramentaria]